jgi:hypothetical protein
LIAPPQLLSSEATHEEVTWSVGEYTPGDAIWKAFNLPGKAPAPVGVFANQPSPHAGKARSAWRLFFLLLLGLFVLLVWRLGSGGDNVFVQKYSFSPRAAGEHSFVTSVFDLKGHPSNVEVAIETDLNNNWAYFNLALINADTGQAYDFGREISYYTGKDSDGTWTEGKKEDSVVLPEVPPGKYYLRVEPEMDAAAKADINYIISIRRDVTTLFFFFIGFAAILIPPIVVTIRSATFEKRRWDQSDYSGGAGGGGDDD